MGHLLKDSLRKMAQKAQESLNLNEEKTQKFLEKAEKAVDVTAEKINQFEKQANAYEGSLVNRLKAARDAFMQSNDGAENKEETKNEQVTEPTAKKPSTRKPK